MTQVAKTVRLFRSPRAETQTISRVGSIARDSSQQSRVKSSLHAQKCTAPSVAQEFLHSLGQTRKCEPAANRSQFGKNFECERLFDGLDLIDVLGLIDGEAPNVEHGMRISRYWSSACPRCPLKAQCTPSNYRRLLAGSTTRSSRLCGSASNALPRPRDCDDKLSNIRWVL